MKKILLKICSPIVNLFEHTDDGSDYTYSPSHRKILAVMGFLFLVVASVGIFFAIQLSALAALFPVVLFGGTGIVCLMVAGLGSDKAVAKLWRNRD